MDNLKINDIQKRISELKKELAVEYWKVFADASKEIFTKYPYLEKFSWRQYTPYFNDGDECTFRVNSDIDTFTINGVEFDGLYISPRIKTETKDRYNNSIYRDMTDEEFNTRTIDGERSAADDVMTAKQVHEMQEELSTFIQSFDEDYMLDVFGDHATVTLHRDGEVSNDEYEHD